MIKSILIWCVVVSFGYSEFLRDNTNNIVLDTSTNLTWEDRNETANTTYTWIDAIDYCKNLTHGGFDDWRVPNINELGTLIDDTKTNPAIKSIFTYIATYYHWSSSTYPSDTSNARYVYFYDGFIDKYSKTNSFYVRCVRDGQ